MLHVANNFRKQQYRKLAREIVCLVYLFINDYRLSIEVMITSRTEVSDEVEEVLC
jgi:hypothetical protein